MELFETVSAFSDVYIARNRRVQFFWRETIDEVKRSARTCVCTLRGKHCACGSCFGHSTSPAQTLITTCFESLFTDERCRSDDASAPPSRPVGRHPIGERDDAIPEADQKVDMDEQPKQPSRVAAQAAFA